MKPEHGNHGYGQHRRESFQNFYYRSVLSEGCGCEERIMDPANHPDPGKTPLRLLLSPIRLWFASRTDSLAKHRCEPE